MTDIGETTDPAIHAEKRPILCLGESPEVAGNEHWDAFRSYSAYIIGGLGRRPAYPRKFDNKWFIIPHEWIDGVTLDSAEVIHDLIKEAILSERSIDLLWGKDPALRRASWAIWKEKQIFRARIGKIAVRMEAIGELMAEMVADPPWTMIAKDQKEEPKEEE